MNVKRPSSDNTTTNKIRDFCKRKKRVKVIKENKTSQTTSTAKGAFFKVEDNKNIADILFYEGLKLKQKVAVNAILCLSFFVSIIIDHSAITGLMVYLFQIFS